MRDDINFFTCIGIILLFMLVASLVIACGPLPKGDTGATGQNGVVGATGATGQPGQSCTTTQLNISPQTPNGGVAISCPNGSTALLLNGAPGADGSNGTNGVNGTLISPIQFCIGTTTYPTTFLEVGFCINNTLYAVYSENSGFLTEVPPGTYASNAVGSSCTFVVGANCTITQTGH
jgi:hypothetical protein